MRLKATIIKVVIATTVIFAGGASGYVYVTKATMRIATQVFPNTSFEGQPLDGMTREQVNEVVHA
ncbi:MAG: hypothetical protein ACRC5C_06775, partial [Bacilli bacterium]